MSLFFSFFFYVRTYSREITDISALVEKKKKKLTFLRDHKSKMIITLLGVYIVIRGLMTLTLFQGHNCVRNVNLMLSVLDSCPL